MFKAFGKTCRAPQPDAMIVSLNEPSRLFGRDTPPAGGRSFSKGGKIDGYYEAVPPHPLPCLQVGKSVVRAWIKV